MVRCLLILALVSNQLLSLGHGAMYVCMGSDGTFCLETDPHACTCCEQGKHEKPAHNSSACACSCTQTEVRLVPEDEKCAQSCEIVSSAREPSAEETVVTNEDDCGCVHLLITSGQSIPSPRVTFDSAFELNRHAGLPQLFSMSRSSLCITSIHFTTRAEIAFCKTRLDVRSLVIRC